MNNPLLKEVKLDFREPYQSMLKITCTSIREYSSQKDVARSGLIYFILLSNFELIRENALEMQIRVEGMGSREDDLLSYIHQNIYFPEMLRIQKVASTFNLSINYFSAYFKKHFEISYNDYVQSYKLQLIEQRIAANVNTLKSIADEFGFTDLSHFNHFFKKNKKTTPKAYRTSIVK